MQVAVAPADDFAFFARYLKDGFLDGPGSTAMVVQGHQQVAAVKKQVFRWADLVADLQRSAVKQKWQSVTADSSPCLSVALSSR